MRTFPWGSLMLVAGVVLLVGEGYFSGENAAGVLLVVFGIWRGIVSLLAATALAAINEAAKEGRLKAPPARTNRWLPPAPPR